MTANDIKRAVAIFEDNGWCADGSGVFNETYPFLSVLFGYDGVSIKYKDKTIFKHSYPFEYSDILDGIGNKIFDKLL
jgi:hypothetical protein